MTPAFFIVAGVLAVAAVAAALYAIRKVRTGELHRGVVESYSEIVPGVPAPNPTTIGRSGYVRYVVRLADEQRVHADSYLPRELGSSAELLFARGRYRFKIDTFLPAGLLAAAAAVALVIAFLVT